MTELSINYRVVQGLEIKDEIKRNTSLLPQIGSGEALSEYKKLNFNIGKPFEENTAFNDRDKVSPQRFIEDPDQFGYPLFVGDYNPNDGAIEPLTIRDVATRESIEFPISKAIKGSLMDGNVDFFGTSDVKINVYRLMDVQYEHFLDSDKSELLISDTIEKEFPFDDVSVDTRFLVDPDKESTDNDLLNNVLLSMNRNIYDNIIPDRMKSVSTGFTYKNAYGIDSIAFGNLLNG